jgi:hypothetical protein
MLRSLGLGASRLLPPRPEALDEVRLALEGEWRAAAIELLAGGWRDQVTAAAAIAVSAAEAGANDELMAALWRAIDTPSWVAPQLVAAALLADPQFEARAADRLAESTRRPPKTIGALVRAYNRCPARRMPVVAQLTVHDRTMATEEARIGVRGVDGWLDYFAATSRSS